MGRTLFWNRGDLDLTVILLCCFPRVPYRRAVGSSWVFSFSVVVELLFFTYFSVEWGIHVSLPQSILWS